MTASPDEDPIAWIEAEEFARGHIEPGERPVDPRPASTIILAREGGNGDGGRDGGAGEGVNHDTGSGAGGFELLLLRRTEASRFAAGAYVFPGGVIDAADADPGLRDRLAPRAAGGEPAALAAALRELFEETGILLADRPPDAESAAAAREALLADRTDFARVSRELDLTFHHLDAVYLARWITPEKLTRRYDTRFFLARNRGGEPALTPEHTEAVWMRPAEAVAGLRAGRLPMLFPTWKTLAALSRFPSLDHALAASAGREVPAILARLERRGGRITPGMSPDPFYDGT